MTTFDETTLGGVALGSLCGSNNPTIVKVDGGSSAIDAGTFASVTGSGSVNWSYSSTRGGWTAGLSGNYVVQTRYLHGDNFGFAIPDGATILGIEARLQFYNESPVTPPTEYLIQLIKAGSRVGDNKSTGASLGSVISGARYYGSSSDLWGESWTAADINNADFGLALQVTLTNNASSPLALCTNSDMRLTVTYGETFTQYDETPCGSAFVTGTATAEAGVISLGGAVASGLASLTGIGSETGSGGVVCAGLSSASLVGVGIVALGGAVAAGSATITTGIVGGGGVACAGLAETRSGQFRYRNLVSIPAGYSAEKFWLALVVPIPSAEVYYPDEFKLRDVDDNDLPFVLRGYEDEKLHVLVKVGLSALSDTQFCVMHGEY